MHSYHFSLSAIYQWYIILHIVIICKSQCYMEHLCYFQLKCYGFVILSECIDIHINMTLPSLSDIYIYNFIYNLHIEAWRLNFYLKSSLSFRAIIHLSAFSYIYLIMSSSAFLCWNNPAQAIMPAIPYAYFIFNVMSFAQDGQQTKM